MSQPVPRANYKVQGCLCLVVHAVLTQSWRQWPVTSRFVRSLVFNRHWNSVDRRWQRLCSYYRHTNMTSWHFRAALLRWLRTTWWSVESAAPHFTWMSRILDSNEFTPPSLTSGRLEPNTLIQPTQTEAPPAPDRIEFTCNEISFTGENSNTLSLSQGVSVLPVPPSLTEHCGKKWVQPAPLQTPGCRVRAECWWEPWLDPAAVTQPPTCSAFCPAYVSPSSHCHWPIATLHNSQFSISLQVVVGPIGTSMHLSLHCVQPGPEDQEPRSLFDGFSIILISIVLAQNPSKICVYQDKNNSIINTYIYIILFFILFYFFYSI